jgi:integrase
MKAGKEHRVPLSEPALEILRRMAELRTSNDPAALVFPGERAGRPMPDGTLNRALAATGFAGTPHGTARSSFRDWAAEATRYQNHIVEMSLGHAIGSAVERAYRRGDLLQQRRVLMRDWGVFCSRPMQAGTVINLRQKQAAAG